MVVAFEILLGPLPRQSVLESSQMLSLLEEDSALGLQSKLQKQGQILNPEAIEIYISALIAMTLHLEMKNHL